MAMYLALKSEVELEQMYVRSKEVSSTAEHLVGKWRWDRVGIRGTRLQADVSSRNQYDRSTTTQYS